MANPPTFQKAVNKKSKNKKEKNGKGFFSDNCALQYLSLCSPVKVHSMMFCPKGQLISKADWCAVDSPKKRTDQFDLFAVKSKKAKKKQIRPFVFWENLWHANLLSKLCN